MRRRDFCKDTLLTGAAIAAAPFVKAAQFNATPPLSLLGNRFVTLCIMIRTSPWEVSRDVKLIKRDEDFAHTLAVVRNMREAFAKNNPNGRLTGALP